jgi:hypothetical protein
MRRNSCSRSLAPSPRRRSRKVTRSAFLDPEFLDLMHDADFRRSAQMVVVETYFPPPERVALYALLGVRAQSPEFQKEVHAPSKQVAEAAGKHGPGARL